LGRIDNVREDDRRENAVGTCRLTGSRNELFNCVEHCLRLAEPVAVVVA